MTIKKPFKFGVGDRVRCISSFDGVDTLIGKIGTFIANNVNGMVGVCFDDWYAGHSLDNKLTGDERRSGRWGNINELELINELRKDRCDCMNRNCNSCPKDF